MPIRFTSNIKHNGRGILLKIHDNNTKACAFSFVVKIKDIDVTDFVLHKENGKPWIIIPDNVPLWIKALQPQLESLIMYKILMEPGLVPGL